jgi:hypothetical protein
LGERLVFLIELASARLPIISAVDWRSSLTASAGIDCANTMSIELRRVGVVGGQVQPVSRERLFHFESREWLGQSGSDGRAVVGAVELTITWTIIN